MGTAKSENYTVTESPGTLEVYPSDTSVTLTAGSASRTYDATPLTSGEVTASGLPEGHTVTSVTAGSLTDAGTAEKPNNSQAAVLGITGGAGGIAVNVNVGLAYNAGENRVAILPYDTLPLVNGASFGRITEAHGTLVYIRAEYVTDNRMTDARTRTLTLSDGTTHTTSMTWYPDLANYSEWIF